MDRAADDAADRDPVRPHVLREYALLADGERGALVGSDGHLAWLCSPHWHSPPVFAALLGGAGHYQVAPHDPWSVWGGRYEPGTLIWRDQWVTRDAVAHCRQALSAPAAARSTVVLRQIVAEDRPIVMDAVLAPGDHLRDLHRTDGVWQARVGDRHLRWSGAADAGPTPDGRVLRHRLRLAPGTRHDLVLEISEHPFTSDPVCPRTAWRATEQHWTANLPDFGDTLAPGDAALAYTVLRGLTSGTGGMVAAATTSLPERARASRNYDYRYAWVRDQCWAGQAVAAHGPHPLLAAAVGFVTDRLLADGPDLRPAYTVAGDLVPEETTLPLPGYPGGADVIGNRVTHQFQLDTFGEALLLFAAAARHDVLDRDGWRAAETAVDAIDRHWDDADAGIWELDPRRWTESRLTCVAGLRQIATVAPAAAAGRWSSHADALLASTARDGLHRSGRWRRAADDDRIDAALLLGALRGALPAHDPRSVATLAAVRNELMEDGYVYRFRHDHRALGDAEGAFLVCGFLTALAAAQQGHPVEAIRLFERHRGICGPAGLFTEEYDVRRRQLRGNLPQAFVHGLLLETATRLAEC